MRRRIYKDSCGMVETLMDLMRMFKKPTRNLEIFHFYQPPH